MGLDIQSRRRKSKTKEALARRLAKEKQEERKKEELSRIIDNPLAALAVGRPDAPEIEEGVSLGSLTGNPAVTMKPNSPPKDGGPIDWDAVAESNPGQPKKPVVFIPPGSQKAEAEKLEQGPAAPPEDNAIDQFADAAEEAGELAEIDQAALADAIASGNEGKQETSGIETEGLDSGVPGFDAEESKAWDAKFAADDLFDDIDSNLKAQLDDYADENPIDIGGDQEADPEAIADSELFPERERRPFEPIPEEGEAGGMMNVADEGEEEVVAEVNPVQAARAKRNSAEFWAERMRAPVQDVMDVMDLAEQELLSQNPEATPQEIKQAQIVALESDEGLNAHKRVHREQIANNVQVQADQTNRARIMGVPRGMVMMLDQINAAESDDDIVKGLITASSVYPQFRPMLQNVITGQVSANALKSQLAMTMAQLGSAEKIAELNAGKGGERGVPDVRSDLANAPFNSQGVQQASMAMQETGTSDPGQRFDTVSRTFAVPMRSIGQQITSGETPNDEDLTTAREVIRLAVGDELPSATQVNRLFGGGMTSTQIEQVVSLLFGEGGLRNLHTGGNIRGVAKDWTGVDPATLFGFDDLDNVG